MYFIILGLLGVTAVLGLLALMKVLKGERPARAVVFGHGLFAVSVVVMLVVLVLQGDTGVKTSLILYIAAATGGYYLLFKDLKGKEIPKSIALLHAGIASIATVIFVAFVVGTL